MKTKEEIVANWLPRYTKRNLEDFGEYILLTNFYKYVEIFAEKFNVPKCGGWWCIRYRSSSHGHNRGWQKNI